MRVKCYTSNFGEIQDFDGEIFLVGFKILQVIAILESFFSFMLSFQPSKVHNMLAFMLDPQYKGLGLVIWYVGKQMALHIVGEYDRKVLFPFFCAYKILNLINENERGLGSFTSHNSQITSLYDVMENDNNMKLSMMKEQFNHFKTKEVN